MQFEQNYFQLFGLPVDFNVDSALLSERYRELQREVHPDRFAHKSDREQRLAVQYTAHINEALNTLKSPLKRCLHLLKLHGREINPETSFRMDPAFLMEQMMLREALEDASSLDDLDALEEQTSALWKTSLKDFCEALSGPDLDQAEANVRKLQFIDKMRHEIEQAEDQLTDN